MGRSGGPLTAENVGAEFYHTILYIVESEKEKGTIWVGADDGLLHLTRDGGDTWQDISPPHRGEAMINAIELSPHTEGTAYVAVTGYKLNDFTPYIYKTTNYGRGWRRIDTGIPDRQFVRVVREDPIREGLLYAGTESGMFVSLDDGKSWQPLRLNLPAVPLQTFELVKTVWRRHPRARILDTGRCLCCPQAGDDLEKNSNGLQGASDSSRQKFREQSAAAAANPSPDVPIYYHLNNVAGKTPD